MEGRDSRAESYQCQGDKCELAVSRASGKLLCKLEVVSGMCVRVCVCVCTYILWVRIQSHGAAYAGVALDDPLCSQGSSHTHRHTHTLLHTLIFAPPFEDCMLQFCFIFSLSLTHSHTLTHTLKCILSHFLTLSLK